MRGKVVYRDNKGRTHSSGEPQGCVYCGEHKDGMIWFTNGIQFDGPWCQEHVHIRSLHRKTRNE